LHENPVFIPPAFEGGDLVGRVSSPRVSTPSKSRAEDELGSEDLAASDRSSFVLPAPGTKFLKILSYISNYEYLRSFREKKRVSFDPKNPFRYDLPPSSAFCRVNIL